MLPRVTTQYVSITYKPGVDLIHIPELYSYLLHSKHLGSREKSNLSQWYKTVRRSIPENSNYHNLRILLEHSVASLDEDNTRYNSENPHTKSSIKSLIKDLNNREKELLLRIQAERDKFPYYLED